MDVLVAGVGLVGLAPALPAIAVAIALDDGGSVFFRQLRVGQHGRLFPIWKFRTMRKGADRDGPNVAGDGDDRVTRLGQFLRASKFDELPQLWNVLRGDMTLIGWRAEVPELFAHYRVDERQLLDDPPGLIGAGSLHFTLHQAHQLDDVDDPMAFHVEHQLHEKLFLDIDYQRRRTWRTDVSLVVTTAKSLLGRRVGAASRRATSAAA